MSEDRELVEIRDLMVEFSSGKQSLVAVQGMNLDLRRGQITCLLGPSGCGKSTVLKTVAGFIRPSRGEVLVGGDRVQGPGSDRAVVFQHYALMPWLTVGKNVEFGLRFNGLPRDERRKIAAECLRLVGLTGFEDRLPYELSGGMRQRVAVARVLAVSPRVMLLDEPFGALDQQTRLLMQRLFIKIINDRQPTALFITHDIDEALILGDRVIVMSARPGQIKADVANPCDRSIGDGLYSTREYVDAKQRIVQLLEEEVEKAFREELETLSGKRVAG